ncbi:uncharacterized protein LOC124149187 isoform X2 [Haliotis rufescens]|uniref:uncharacterized protein LOC124149187 isoform X2 n=1 Tax=Haliotis rufescens TaxID=6454 RepID=UPI00201F3863|nr:uncharacterized protein LOC124149187 isoform X2 [Haliotis rufescens]
METQYSVQFFASFVEQLQDVCRNYLHFSQFVEVSGYVCVEIDNMKKERYVLSELLQSSGNVVSESYCTKAFKTNRNIGNPRGRFGERALNIEQNTGESHLGFGRNKQTIQHPGHIPHALKRQDVVQTSRYQQESSPGPPRQQHSSSSHDTIESFDGSRYQQESSPGPPRQQHSSHDTIESFDGSWVVNQLTEERVTLPQMLSQDDSEPSTSAAPSSAVSSTPSNQLLHLPQDDEVIDLDLFDDDLDVAMEEEGSRNVFYSGLTFASSPSTPVDSFQRKRGHLSPASLATMRYTVKQFQRFLFHKCNQNIDLFSTTPERLNELLLDFFREAKKVHGGEYLRPRSLKNVQTCLDKLLKDGGYPYSVLRDKQFQSSREYLKKKLNESTANASGANTVTEEDIETLFQTQLLGSHNPESLTNTMWFLNSKFFILKHPLEHQNLKWGDISLRMDDKGQEYLERLVGGRYTLKVFSKPASPNRCFVNFYKQYRALRPKITLEDEYNFYLRVDDSSDQSCWFMPEPIRPVTLTCMWKKIVLTARLPGRRSLG